MANVRVINKVYRLKHGKKHNVPGIGDLDFIDGEEFHIVSDMLYMRGYPLPGNMQQPLIKWINDNPSLFVYDTRNF